MEREFDARALLKNTSAFSFKETKKSEVYKRLMNTDVLDLELEDRLHDVLEERGVEIGSKEYDKEIKDLQDEFLREKTGYVEEDFSFVGQPCGNAHISINYTCRIGASGLDFRKADDATIEKLEKKYEAFEKSLEGYSPAAQAKFKETVSTSITELSKPASEQRTAISNEDAIKAYGRVLDNAKIMADDGPPTQILSKTGDPMPMSDKIYPVLSRKGNMQWKDPEIGVSFTKHSKGEMELIQNREVFANNLKDGRVKDAIAHYEKYQSSASLQAKGEFGSPAVSKLRDVSQKEIDERWSSLSKEEKRAVSMSGVDSVGGRKVAASGEIDQRSEHNAFYSRNPDLLERRGKEVLGAYLQQTPGPGEPARSAFTGKEIPLPGTFGPGGKSVVDHYAPLANAYPEDRTKPWSRSVGQKVMAQADSRSNMVIVEGGLNHSKSAREDWSKDIIPGWQKNVKNYEKNLKKVEKMPSFTRSGGPTKVEPPKGLTSRGSGSTTRAKTTRKASGKTAAQKASEKEAKAAATRKKKQEAETAKNQKKIDKLSKATSDARAKRDKYKPGSAMYKKWNDKVSEAATAERRMKKDLGLL